MCACVVHVVLVARPQSTHYWRCLVSRSSEFSGEESEKYNIGHPLCISPSPLPAIRVVYYCARAAARPLLRRKPQNHGYVVYAECACVCVCGKCHPPSNDVAAAAASVASVAVALLSLSLSLPIDQTVCGLFLSLRMRSIIPSRRRCSWRKTEKEKIPLPPSLFYRKCSTHTKSVTHKGRERSDAEQRERDPQNDDTKGKARSNPSNSVRVCSSVL